MRGRRLRALLATGMLVVLVALTPSACTGGGQENKSPGSSEPRATNLHGKILFTLHSRGERDP
jgi:hypothetical protein